MLLEFPSLLSKAKYLNKSEPMLLPLEAVTSPQKQSSPGTIALGITTTKAPQTHPGQQPKAHSSAAGGQPAIGNVG